MLKVDKIKSALAENSFISEVYYFQEINSTNSFAKTLTAENSALVITDYQTNGLGRLNRIWESEKGKNLTFTIKRHFDVDTDNIQSVNFYFSYFLLAFLKDFTAKNKPPGMVFPELSIKWPNDIILNSRKVSGLLIENNLNKKEFIIGIGININQETFSKEYSDKATSLKNNFHMNVDLSDFLIELIKTYEKNIYLLKDKQYNIIYKLWKNSSCLIDKEVTFQENTQIIKIGKIIDLMKDGGIKIMQKDEIFTYYSGDIKIHP